MHMPMPPTHAFRTERSVLRLVREHNQAKSEDEVCVLEINDIGVMMNVRKHLESLPAYTPIEPFEVLSARIGREPSQIVKLDANENPYGPLPVVREALGKMEFPHIYPDPESRALRKSLAAFTDIAAE